MMCNGYNNYISYQIYIQYFDVFISLYLHIWASFFFNYSFAGLRSCVWHCDGYFYHCGERRRFKLRHEGNMFDCKSSRGIVPICSNTRWCLISLLCFTYRYSEGRKGSWNRLCGWLDCEKASVQKLLAIWFCLFQIIAHFDFVLGQFSLANVSVADPKTDQEGGAK